MSDRKAGVRWQSTTVWCHGLMETPRSQFHEGRFGLLFRQLNKFEPAEADLIELADRVIEKAFDVERAKPEDAPRPWNIADPVNGLSSGFTYLVKFIDHDLTFDRVSQLDRINDPDALRDFRTPRFNLDNVYGSGPDQDLSSTTRRTASICYPQSPRRVISSAIPHAPQSSATLAMTRMPSSRTYT